MTEQADRFVRNQLGAKDSLGFAASLAYLRQAAGSGRGAARLAGVDEAQLRRWAAGQTPRAGSRDKVERAARELRTPQAPDQAGFKLVGVTNQETRRARRSRERKPIPAAKLDLAPGTVARARAVYVATGNTDKALHTFLKGVGNDFYRINLAPREWIDDPDIDYEPEYDLGEDYFMSF